VTRRRNTKIVATIGPASTRCEVLGAMIEAGLNVARLNCSHATRGDLAIQVENIRRMARLKQRSVATLLDLSGPKVRSGTLQAGTMELVEGAALRVVPGSAPGQDDWITCNHDGLASDVSEGDRILLDDGLMELRVTKIDGERVVHTEVVFGGTLKERKGMNLPDNIVSIPALTEKDKEDLAVGLELGVDYVALSFVQHPRDIQMLKDAMSEFGVSRPIIAKIEKPQAIDNLDSILAEVEGVMVARGDLAVEVGNHRVPLLQKQILQKSNARGTLDIVATQMLDSMTYSPRPTRAEASDVANAVLDGCDAVMLSGETAVGDFPVESIAMMDAIARDVEPWMSDRRTAKTHRIRDEEEHYSKITMAVVRSASEIARLEGVQALMVFTLSGRTARLLSGMYPKVPIFALTPRHSTEQAMALYRGVTPVYMPFPGNSDAMVAAGEAALVDRGFLQPGDEAIVVAGFTELRGVANMVKVVRV